MEEISENGDAQSENGSHAVVNKDGLLVLEPKPLRPFKTQDEYLYAMKEDLAEWFNTLYETDINVEIFFEQLETGVLICQHANNVQKMIDKHNWVLVGNDGEDFDPKCHSKLVQFRHSAKPESWGARDNVANFISWCRTLGIMDVLLFETDDLVLRKNPKSVVLCLLEVARIGAKYGMLAPLLIQFEREIEQEIEREQRCEQGHDSASNHYVEEPVVLQPPPQRITCDLRSLDELVRDLVSICTCPVQFRVVRLAEGKYQVGDSHTTVFVRVLRSHVMVRVGGGWDTLENYLNKHDPCRCKAKGHGFSNKGRVRRLSAPALFLPDQMQTNSQKSSSIPSSSERVPAHKLQRKASLQAEQRPQQHLRSSSMTRLTTRDHSGSREKLNKNLSGSLQRLKTTDKEGLNKSKIGRPSTPDRGLKSSRIPNRGVNQRVGGSARNTPELHRRAWTTGSAALSDSEADTIPLSIKVSTQQRVKRTHRKPSKEGAKETLLFTRDEQGKHKLQSIERYDNEKDFNKMIIETSQSIQMQMQQLVGTEYGDGTSTEFSWSDTTSQASDVMSESSLDEMIRFQQDKRGNGTNSSSPRPPPYPRKDFRHGSLPREIKPDERRPAKVTRHSSMPRSSQKPDSAALKRLAAHKSNIQRANGDNQKQTQTSRKLFDNHKRVNSRENLVSRSKPSPDYFTNVDCNSCGCPIGRKQTHLCSRCQRVFDINKKVEESGNLIRRHSESDLTSTFESWRHPNHSMSLKASPRKDKHIGKPTRIPGPVTEPYFALHRTDSGVDINGGSDS